MSASYPLFKNLGNLFKLIFEALVARLFTVFPIPSLEDCHMAIDEMLGGDLPQFGGRWKISGKGHLRDRAD